MRTSVPKGLQLVLSLFKIPEPNAILHIIRRWATLAFVNLPTMHRTWQ